MKINIRNVEFDKYLLTIKKKGLTINIDLTEKEIRKLKDDVIDAICYY